MKKRSALSIALTGAILGVLVFLAVSIFLRPKHVVTLSWTASVTPGVSSYNIYRGSVSGGPYIPLAKGIQGTSFEDKTVRSGATYYYMVKAFNGVESDASGEKKAVIPGP